MTTVASHIAPDAMLALQVQVLHGVLPYLQSIRGKALVLLCEGAVISDAVLRLALGRDLALLQLVGVRLVLVHGRLAAGASALEHQHQELLQMLSQHGCDPLSLTASGVGCGGLPGLLQRSHAKGFVPVVKAVCKATDGRQAAVDAAELALDLARQLTAHRLLLVVDAGSHTDGEFGLGLTAQGAHVAAQLQHGATARARHSPTKADVSNFHPGRVRAIDGGQLHALLMEVLGCPGANAAASPHHSPAPV